MLEHVKSMRDSLDLLKRYLDNPGESVNITMLKELVKACSDSHSYLFEESLLANSTGDEEEKYLKFIDQKKKEGHSVIVLVKTKNKYVMVGGMAPEDLAYFINVLMGCKDVAKYALMAKMKERGGDVYSIPGVEKIEEQFIDSMLSSDPKHTTKGKNILVNATEKLAGLKSSLSPTDRRKKVFKVIEEVASDFKQMSGGEIDPEETLKKMFGEEEDTKTE
jgi:hypothetical protein